MSILFLCLPMTLAGGSARCTWPPEEHRLQGLQQCWVAWAGAVICRCFMQTVCSHMQRTTKLCFSSCLVFLLHLSCIFLTFLQLIIGFWISSLSRPTDPLSDFVSSTVIIDREPWDERAKLPLWSSLYYSSDLLSVFLVSCAYIPSGSVLAMWTLCVLNSSLHRGQPQQASFSLLKASTASTAEFCQLGNSCRHTGFRQF